MASHKWIWKKGEELKSSQSSRFAHGTNLGEFERKAASVLTIDQLHGYLGRYVRIQFDKSIFGGAWKQNISAIRWRFFPWTAGCSICQAQRCRFFHQFSDRLKALCTPAAGLAKDNMQRAHSWCGVWEWADSNLKWTIPWWRVPGKPRKRSLAQRCLKLMYDEIWYLNIFDMILDFMLRIHVVYSIYSH